MPKTKFEPREGWWFSARSGVLPHGDGRPIVIGEKLSVKGKLVICQNALHGSYDPFDALQYAPGPILHKVLFTGARIGESDKLGSRSRTVIASRDAEMVLRLFARRQALSVAHLWNMPAVVRQYLETGDETLWDAARDAARDVARATAWDAARATARAATWDVAWDAWDAAWDAARATAWDAARATARAAAWAAAWAGTWAGTWAAAHDAARAAALAAARDAARQMFNEMVAELFSQEAGHV